MNLPAIRTLNRILRLHSNVLEQGMAADYGFDSGEWSVPHYYRLWDATVNRVTALVAQRYGMTQAQLEADVQAFEYDYCNRHFH